MRERWRARSLGQIAFLYRSGVGGGEGLLRPSQNRLSTTEARLPLRSPMGDAFPSVGAGKVARTLAGRCSIAARLDAYEGTPMTAEDVAEVEAKVLAIRAAHPRPPSRKGGVSMGRASGKPPGRPLSDAVRLDGHALWTWSANPERQSTAKRCEAKHGEWRRWDPRRSKVASGLLRTSGALSVSFHQPVTTCSTGSRSRHHGEPHPRRGLPRRSTGPRGRRGPLAAVSA